METRAHYVAVGAFVLTMIVLAFAAVLWLARAGLTTQYADYDIYFKGPVSGLSIGAAVDYSGVPVGKVSDVRIDSANVEQIRVTVEIDSGTVIKDDARAAVETNLLSGVSYIQIVGGTQDAPVLVAQAGERYPVIRSHRSRLASVTAEAPQLIEKAGETLDHLNDLLSEKNRNAVSETLENIRVVSGGVAERRREITDLIANVNAAARTLSTLLNNVDQSYSGADGLGNRAATALADFDHLAKNLSDTNRQLQLGLQDVRPGLRTFSQQTLGDVGALVGEARQLISGLSRLTAQIERDPSRVLFGDRREGYRPR
jgi:phospholipid/cholesterol/gamma-HCH transport system substrate-binding protein